MDDRVRDRRRSVTRQRGRRRGVVAAVAFLLVAVVALFLWLRSSDVFAVRTITATATQSVTQEEIAHAAAGAFGVSLLRLSTVEVEKALLALPYVRSAKVYRSFPNALDVHLVEYQPFARLQGANGQVWLIAEDGRVLERAQTSKGADLPLVVPANPVSVAPGDKVSGVVLQALPVVAALESGEIADSLSTVQRVSVSAAGELVLYLAGGGELRLGEPTELERKLKAAADILEKYLRGKKQIDYIDVSVPDRVAVKAK